LEADLNIKVVDFGFSNEFTIGHKLNTFCGSPPYAKSTTASWWPGGAWSHPLYNDCPVTSRCLPLQDFGELWEWVLSGIYCTPLYMSVECENLLEKLLALNPSERSALEETMKDPWMNMSMKRN